MIIQIDAHYYDGLSSKQHAVKASLYNGLLQVHGDDCGSHTIQLPDLKIAPRVGKFSKRIIHLPEGAKLEFDGDALIDQIHLQIKPKPGFHGLAYFLESKLKYALIALALCGIFTWGFFIYGIPHFAKQIAFSVSPETAAKLGEGTLATLDKILFVPSSLPQVRQDQLRQRFMQMVASDSSGHQFRLEFRGSPKIGANAFALPSGIVVMTDELVALAQHDDEIVSIFAHEIGHVVQRHSLRMVLQDSAVGLLITLFTGDISSTSIIISSLPIIIADSKYSRDFESEADDYALAYLLKNNISPKVFSNIMNRLTQGDKKGGGKITVPDFLRSHPTTQERVQKFEKAGLN